MLRSVFTKTLYDHRRTMLGWGVGFLLMMAWIIPLYPTIQNQPGIEELWQDMPEAVKAMFGMEGELDLTSPAGYLEAELFSFMLPLLIIIFAAMVGSAAVAGEEEKGTLDLLLAQPVSRVRVALEKFAAFAVMATGLVAIVPLVIIALGPAFEVDIAVTHVLAASVGLLLTGLFFGGLAMAVGSATGRRGLAGAITAAVAVAGFLVDSLAGITEVFEPLAPFSPFRWTTGTHPLREGFDPLSTVLLAVTAAAVALGVWLLDRRDVAV